MELLSSVTKTPIRYSPNHAELLMLLMHNINLLIISVSIYIAEVQKKSNFVKYEANCTCALYKKPGNIKRCCNDLNNLKSLEDLLFPNKQNRHAHPTISSKKKLNVL